MSAAPRRRVRRGEPIPVWRQIEIDLTFEIRTGFFGPGDRLPSESELAKAYGVHRHTVRVALARLADEGLVVARQGKGVFVARRPVEYAVTRESKWSEFEQRLAARPDGKLLRSSRRTANAELAALLAIAPGSELLVLESLRRAGPGVSAYCYHVFEHARFAGIDEAFRRLRSYTPALAELGHPEFFRTRTWIDGRLPRADEARALAVGSDTPVMVMSYIDAGRDGAPILFGSAVVPAGRLRFRVDSP